MSIPPLPSKAVTSSDPSLLPILTMKLRGLYYESEYAVNVIHASAPPSSRGTAVQIRQKWTGGERGFPSVFGSSVRFPKTTLRLLSNSSTLTTSSPLYSMSPVKWESRFA